MKILFDKMYKVNENISIDDIKISKHVNDFKGNDYNRFMEKNIKDYIIKNLKQFYKIKIKNDMKIKLYTNNYKNINLIKILKIYYFVCSLNSNNKALVLDIYDCPHKKMLELNINCIGPKHVNSGSTTNRQYIQMWRKEELYKVFIHEMIHFLHYDYVDLHNTISDRLYDIFKLQINSNEAYVETWTTLIKCIFIAHDLLKEDGINKKLIKFNSLLDKEIEFSLYQAAKILKFYGFNDMDELFKNDGQFKQESNVFSYYIIKSALLNNIDEFINFTKYGTKDISIKFIETKDNLIKFYELIISSLKNGKFKNKINNLLKRNDLLDDKSLCMTFPNNKF